jgi:hypothetical protein
MLPSGIIIRHEPASAEIQTRLTKKSKNSLLPVEGILVTGNLYHYINQDMEIWFIAVWKEGVVPLHEIVYMELTSDEAAAWLEAHGYSLPSAPEPASPPGTSEQNPIPMERRSRPVPKIRAAKALNLPGTDSAKRKALNQMIESGSITCYKETGNRFTFDRQQIPTLPALGGQAT